MRQKSGPHKATPEWVVKDIRRATRKRHFAEERIRIVLDGLRGEDSIAELCRRGGMPDDIGPTPGIHTGVSRLGGKAEVAEGLC